MLQKLKIQIYTDSFFCQYWLLPLSQNSDTGRVLYEMVEGKSSVCIFGKLLYFVHYMLLSFGKKCIQYKVSCNHNCFIGLRNKYYLYVRFKEKEKKRTTNILLLIRALILKFVVLIKININLA